MGFMRHTLGYMQHLIKGNFGQAGGFQPETKGNGQLGLWGQLVYRLNKLLPQALPFYLRQNLMFYVL